MTLLLKNATYINWQTLEFVKTNIFIEEGTVKNIKFIDDKHYISADEIIDCSGKLITKSFAVGHHHVYSALARGMPAPKKNPSNFYEILKYIWWNIDKNLDKDMIEASAMTTAMACVKAGSTFVIDHHASPNFIEGSLEIIANAFDRIGVSHLLCYEITDRNGKEKVEKGFAETENYLKNHQALIGLHASFTVTDDTMKKAADLMQKYNSGVHIHVAEDKYDQEHSIKNYGKRVVERLHDFGLLDSSKTLLGHCLHLSDNERYIIKNSKAFVAQNTESNLNNNVGFFSSKNLGNNIILGTDGMHSDMIRSAQASYFVGQSFDDIDFQSAYQRFRKGHHYLHINKFSGDGDNNLVVLDYPSPTPINKSNFLGHFIFGLRAEHVQHVISNGKLIVKNRQLQNENEEDILNFAKKQAQRLWSKLI